MKYLSIMSVLLLIGGNVTLAIDKSDIPDENETNISVNKDDDYRLQLENKYQEFFKNNKQYIGRILFGRNRELTIAFLEHMKEQKLNKSYFNIYYYFEWLMKNYIIDHVRWLLKKKAEKDNVKYEDKSDGEIEKFFMENTALVKKLTEEFYKDFEKGKLEMMEQSDFWDNVD